LSISIINIIISNHQYKGDRYERSTRELNPRTSRSGSAAVDSVGAAICRWDTGPFSQLVHGRSRGARSPSADHDAIANGKLIAVFTQRDASIEEPAQPICSAWARHALHEFKLPTEPAAHVRGWRA